MHSEILSGSVHSMTSNHLMIILQLSSAFAFMGYGIACLTTPHMKQEFERYGLQQFRALTGCLEISGGAGLLIGFFTSQPILSLLASVGLAILMICGIGIRLRIKDSFLQCLPAIILFVVNSVIAFSHFQTLKP
jgi:uncharacterized membrane protein YphA (DoxX/SURF4 family)